MRRCGDILLGEGKLLLAGDIIRNVRVSTKLLELMLYSNSRGGILNQKCQSMGTGDEHHISVQ